LACAPWKSQCYNHPKQHTTEHKSKSKSMCGNQIEAQQKIIQPGAFSNTNQNVVGHTRATKTRTQTEPNPSPKNQGRKQNSSPWMEVWKCIHIYFEAELKRSAIPIPIQILILIPISMPTRCRGCCGFQKGALKMF